MSKLSRYNLLISLIRSELRYNHNLGSSSICQKQNDLLIFRSTEAWIFLADDLMYENKLSVQARDTRITNLLKHLNACHISLTLSVLKKTYDILIRHISMKRVLTDYNDFKGQFSSCEETLLGLLMSPVKESLSSVIRSQTFVSRGVYGSTIRKDMWICAHYLLFLTKINLVGIGLEDEALIDYKASELETSLLKPTSYSLYVPALNHILKDWLSDWDYDGYEPQHGPGSVADTVRSKVRKYQALAVDAKVRYLYGNELVGVIPSMGLTKSFQRISKLVFVPKNITKLRSISMEPATLQYLQQGCMHSLYTYFKTQRELRQVLKLSDQFQNQSFAYHGSITDDYATIDLSHASDSVNWLLVKSLFRRTPKLLKWLLCTRSSHTTLPDGEIVCLTKFAPMGSALCFPIESLIFAAIAKLSILLCREKAVDRDNCTGLRSSIQHYSIYGDDIIVPKYAASKCIEILRTLGFTPNEEKSYLTGPFKESCGGNFFCGYDITALKFSPKLDPRFNLGISPDAYSAFCSYANLAYSKGLRLTRLYFIKVIFEAGLKPLFTDNLNESPAIFSSQPTNFHLRKHYRKDYQKYQYEYTGIKAVEKVDNDTITSIEEIYLFDKQLVVSRRDDSNINYFINASIHNPPASNRSGKYCYNEYYNNWCGPTHITFDTLSGYSRSTLLSQVSMYTLCQKDV